MTVPVTVLILDEPPNDDLDGWDQVNESSIEIPSGKIVIAGSTDIFSEAIRISVRPNLYRVRVCYGGLYTLSEDGLEGEDHYKILLWTASEADAQASEADVQVLKMRIT